ncbi:MAG TPA: hypothetical protein VF026_01565 [Ktedonobacteraceae bacterium]
MNIRTSIVRMTIDAGEPGTLPRFELKAKRVDDQRRRFLGQQ